MGKYFIAVSVNKTLSDKSPEILKRLESVCVHKNVLLGLGRLSRKEAGYLGEK